MTFTDAYLNYHADRYAAQRIHAFGVSLETYLMATPEQQADYDRLALEPEPLLPAQERVRERLEATQ